MATRKQAATNTGESEQGEQTSWGVPIPGTGGPVGAGAIVARDETAQELEPGQKIVMLLSGGSLSDETQVRVYKRLPNSTKYAWCKNYNAHEFLAGDLEMIRNEWGPGEYSMRVYGGPNGMEREDVTISAPIVASNPTNPVPTQVAMQHQSEMARVLEKISEQNAALLAAVSQKPDPMQNMSVMLEMARSMREAFGIGGAAPVAVAPVSPIQQITEMAAAMRALKEVSKEIGGEPAEDTPTGMLSQVVELVKTGLAMRQNPALPMQSEPLQPMQLPASLQHSSAQASQPANESDPGMLIIKGTLAELLVIKNRGGTVEQGGEFIADKLPDDLLPYLELPNWFEIASGFAPELKAHETWVKAATAHAVTLLASDSGQ